MATWPTGQKCSFYDDPDRVIWVQPVHPGHVVESLDKTFYDDHFCLMVNSEDKNFKKSAETLDPENF